MNSQFTLHDLIDGIAGLPKQGSNIICGEAVVRMIHCDGPLNSHLEFPLDPDSKRSHWDRKIPLSLDTPVYGQFLTLSYCGHEPDLILQEHNSLDEMARHIMGPVGILNCWIDALFAFHQLSPLPYRISFDLADSKENIFDVEDRIAIRELSRLTPPQCKNIKFTWENGAE